MAEYVQTKFDSKSFNPVAFGKYVERIPSTKRNELIKSRALRGNPQIKAAFSSQTGTAYGQQSLRLGKAIEARVKAAGQNSRGVKTRLTGSGTDYFGWLRQVKAPAVLCEGFFVDNAKDRVDFDAAAEQRALGVAYAHGVLDYLGIAVKPVEDKPSPEPEPNNPAIHWDELRGILESAGIESIEM